MSVDEQGLNPHRPGSPEHAEWEAIAHAPAWHSRDLSTRRRALAAAAETRPAELLSADHAATLAHLAAGGVLLGPDVSQYQGLPAWATVKAAGCRIGWRKATEGRTFLDPSAEHNRAGIPGAGLTGGAYHFLYFSQEYADKPALWGAQADWFARNVDASEGHALDVEAAASAGNHLGVKEWVAEYRRLFPGHPLGGYLNKSLWRNRSRIPYDPADVFDYIWHAGIGDGYYTAATGSLPAEWAAVKTLSNSVAAMGYPVVNLWQYTDHAQVPGVGGTFCDGNAFQGGAAEYAALLTGKTPGDDSMSAQDVQNLETYLASDAFTRVVRAAVHGTPIGKLTNADGSPVTLGQAVSLLWAALPNVDELSPAAVASVTAAITPVIQGQAAQGGLSRGELVDALTEALSRIHVVADAPAAGGA